MMVDLDLDGIRKVFNDRKYELERWKENVVSAITSDPVLQKELRPIFVKGRVKDEESLIEKVTDKHDPTYRVISPENLFVEIEDLVGVRLVVAQKAHIRKAIARIRVLEMQGVWTIVDEVHYGWHPDEILEIERDGIDAETKPSAYCSRHFILSQHGDDFESEDLVKCELQVRTVLEEAIFENDHRIRYKKSHGAFTGKVLARLAEILETADRLLVDAYEVAEKEKET